MSTQTHTVNTDTHSTGTDKTRQQWSSCSGDSKSTLYKLLSDSINPRHPLLTYGTRMGMMMTMKHPVPDRVKPSFVIFDIQALWRSDALRLWRSALSVRVPRCQKYKWRHKPVWHRMHYSCKRMATLFTCCILFANNEQSESTDLRLWCLRQIHCQCWVINELDWMADRQTNLPRKEDRRHLKWNTNGHDND